MQAGERRLDVVDVAALADRWADEDGVATIAEGVSDEGEEDLRLAEAHVVAGDGPTEALDGLRQVQVASRLVGLEGAQHALHGDLAAGIQRA